MRDRESTSDYGKMDGPRCIKRARAARLQRLELRRMESSGSDEDPKRARIDAARPACKPVEVESGMETGSSDLVMTSSSSEEDLDRIFRAGGDLPIGILASGGEGAGRMPCRSHGSVSVCGRRRDMEDALTVAPGLVVAGGAARYDFFGVYDGHGGALVAQACRERLHRIVASEVERRAAGGGEVDWKEAMEACFAAMDGEVSAEVKTIGSTAVVALVGTGSVVVANCGDSRAVLSRGGVAVQLSRDHKVLRICRMFEITIRMPEDGCLHPGVCWMRTPMRDHDITKYIQWAKHYYDGNLGFNFGSLKQIDCYDLIRSIFDISMYHINLWKVLILGTVTLQPDRPDEMERVEAAGGRVINWDGYRVLGVLATSRSIGDHYMKPFVISEPEVIVTHRTDADEFLILASDGLWDVVPNDMACMVTRRCLNSQRKKQLLEGGGGSTGAAEAAALLAELAMGRGSRDNISIVVVELRGTNSR